jgi:voltage-gated potassium channel
VNPLQAVWQWLRAHREPDGVGAPAIEAVDPQQATAAIFLVMRRMRTPIIVLIVVFSVSVVGLTVIPGQHADGSTRPLSFFDAFYVMSYTATTIGFGELPDPFTTAQRAWVTVAIFGGVVGWAYALGSLLALLQDRSFRRALDTQRFRRQVARMPEPFEIVVGFGAAGRRVVRELDGRARRLVVVDRAQDRVDALELEALHSDVPALAADGGLPTTLRLAGLGHPRCAGVLALTDDDRTNLAVVQSVHLLAPGVPVLARSAGPETTRRMRAFGRPTVVNPYDAFGDRLRLAVRAPVTAQLVDWLISPVGAGLPPRRMPPQEGTWIVVGADREVGEVLADLQEAGLPTHVLDPHGARPIAPEDDAFAQLVSGAAGLVAGTESDTLNVSYVEAARRIHPGVFVVVRQKDEANTALLAALQPDLVLVPSEVVAREVLQRLASPDLWAYLLEVTGRGDGWARPLLERLRACCGEASPAVWTIEVVPAQCGALCAVVDSGDVRLARLLASPWEREVPLPAIVLMITRGDQRLVDPEDDAPVRTGDRLLLVGTPAAHNALAVTVTDPDALGYVLSGVATPTTWWGRRLLGARRPG